MDGSINGEKRGGNAQDRKGKRVSTAGCRSLTEAAVHRQPLPLSGQRHHHHRCQSPSPFPAEAAHAKQAAVSCSLLCLGRMGSTRVVLKGEVIPPPPPPPPHSRAPSAKVRPFPHRIPTPCPHPPRFPPNQTRYSPEAGGRLLLLLKLAHQEYELNKVPVSPSPKPNHLPRSPADREKWRRSLSPSLARIIATLDKRRRAFCGIPHFSRWDRGCSSPVYSGTSS